MDTVVMLKRSKSVQKRSVLKEPIMVEIIIVVYVSHNQCNWHMICFEAAGKDDFI